MSKMIDQELLVRWSDDIYRFTMLVMDEMRQPRDYGDGQVLNMVEIHTIAMIAEEPGLCISEVAKKWNRTLGAASRNINRLVDKGYVIKRKEEGDDKTIHLYLTARGQKLAEQHHNLDLQVTNEFSKIIAEKHEWSELVTFHDVLETLYDFYKARGQQAQ